MSQLSDPPVNFPAMSALSEELQSPLPPGKNPGGTTWTEQRKENGGGGDDGAAQGARGRWR